MDGLICAAVAERRVKFMNQIAMEVLGYGKTTISYARFRTEVIPAWAYKKAITNKKGDISRRKIFLRDKIRPEVTIDK